MGYFSIRNFPLRYRRNPMWNLQIDDLSAGMNPGAAASDLGDSETQIAENVLMNQPGLVLQRRGSIPNLYASSLASFPKWSPRIGVFDGTPPFPTAPVQPYALVTDALNGVTHQGALYVQQASSALARVCFVPDAYNGATGGGTDYNTHGVSLTQSAMFNDDLVQAGATNTANVLVDAFSPMALTRFGGNTTATWSGTGTLTNGSTSFSLTSPPTNAQGMYLVVPGDTAGANVMAYRIMANGKLDRPYAGTTGSKAIWLNAAACIHADSSVFASRFVRAAHVTTWQGRLLVANLDEGNNVSLSTDPSFHKPNRIRWCGVFDPVHPQAYPLSSTLLTDIHAWHPNAYLDVTPAFGAIRGMQVFGSALVVFQQRGITVINGTPKFTGVGTLDQTTIFPGFSVLPWSFCETPYGVFFYDRTRGLFVWSGTGLPKQVSDHRMSGELFSVLGVSPTSPDTGPSLGYLSPDHLVIAQPYLGGQFNQRAYLLYIKTNAWARLSNVNTTYGAQQPALAQVFPGRSSVRGERLIGWGQNKELAGVGNILDSAGGDSYYDMAPATGQTYYSLLTTKLYGPENVRLRMRRIDATMVWNGGNTAGTQISVAMGQAGQFSGNASSITTTGLTPPGNPGQFATVHKLTNTKRDTHVSISITSSDYSFTVREIIVNGYVAQEADS